MGLMLDSSIVIGAERRGDTPEQLIERLANAIPDQPLAISAIALTEIVHAVFRAPTPERRLQRETFIRQLVMDIEVLPYTRDTAFLAGQIDGQRRALGITIPSIDLLIGATALEIGYSVVTANLRHFKLIPGLSVIAL
jgi:tRNA(fMet)-specific endonuclease VapC